MDGKLNTLLAYVANPDEVRNLYSVIREAVIGSLSESGPLNEFQVSNVIEAARRGAVQCWLIYLPDKEGTQELLGVGLTRILADPLLQTKQLLIYGLYGFDGLSDTAWAAGFARVCEFAKIEGCSEVVAYTKNPRVLEIADAIGMDSQWRFIKKEVV